MSHALISARHSLVGHRLELPQYLTRPNGGPARLRVQRKAPTVLILWAAMINGFLRKITRAEACSAFARLRTRPYAAARNTVCSSTVLHERVESLAGDRRMCALRGPHPRPRRHQVVPNIARRHGWGRDEHPHWADLCRSGAMLEGSYPAQSCLRCRLVETAGSHGLL